jgi:hypothetical protein
MRFLISATLFVATLAAQPHSQPDHSQPILGTVTEFRMGSLQIGVKPDDAAGLMFKVSPETEVVRVPPGERDLQKAKPAQVTDLALGDRILVSFVPGMHEARRILVISSTDIAQRNEAIRLNWEKRGVSGTVAATSGNEITLEIRTPGEVHTTIVTLSDKTILRRYAPDSVKFADARISPAAAIAKGDQFKVRGAKSEDGGRIIAEEAVFGTFLTKVGTVTSIDTASNRFEMQDITTKAPLTIKLTADSKFKKVKFPEPGSSESTHDPSHGSTFDLARVFEALPSGSLDELKVGSAVIVSSTRGNDNGEVTAILVLANADFLIMMAKSQAADKNISVSGALGQMHGGMLGGSSGLSLPAILP